jgi:hypothetical protein
MDSFKVIGSCVVADTPPGEVVSREKLEQEGANIDALLAGLHLEPVSTPKTDTTKAKAKPSDGE